jgi:hypothetical protein
MDIGQAYNDAWITEHYPPTQWWEEIVIGIRICGLAEGGCEITMKECVVTGNTLRMSKPLWWASGTGASTAAVVVGYGAA